MGKLDGITVNYDFDEYLTLEKDGVSYAISSYDDVGEEELFSMAQLWWYFFLFSFIVIFGKRCYNIYVTIMKWR